MTDAIYTRSATLAPATLDLERRTCEAVISSGAVVLRRGLHPDGTDFGPWYERLDLAGADLAALQGGPVLIDHQSDASDARIGVVEAVRLQGGQLVARLRFSSRATPLLQDLAEGIGGAVSVGYQVQEWTADGT